MKRQGARDLDELPLGQAQFGHEAARIDVMSQLFHQLAGALVDFAPSHPTAFAGVPAEEDILRRGQLRYQREFLVDESDAEILRVAGRARRDGAALPEDVAAVGREGRR